MGLRIRNSKTKMMRVNATNTDEKELDGEEFDELRDLAYLGSNTSKYR